MTRSSDPKAGATQDRRTTPRPSPGPAPTDVVLIVRVVRTGGFAGLRKEWTAEPAPDEASAWIPLIEDCPWDDVGSAPATGADRFVWRISARCDPEPERSAQLGDGDVTGAWRTLVDAVREFRP